jgi:ferredoxin-type protein NapH
MTISRRQRVRQLVLFFLFLVFPITINYYSPYLIIQSASEGTINASFVFYALFGLTSFFIGRLACGYVCPLGAAQMLLTKAQVKPLVRIKHLSMVKYALAVAWVGAIVFVAASAGGYSRVNLLYSTENYISTDSLQGILLYYGIVLIPIVPALFLGKRAFCHYFCPFSVLNIVGTKLSQWLRLPALHLRAKSEACIDCRRCTRNCPKSLSVHEMVQLGDMRATECINCGNCESNCPANAIEFAWRRTG